MLPSLCSSCRLLQTTPFMTWLRRVPSSLFIMHTTFLSFTLWVNLLAYFQTQPVSYLLPETGGSIVTENFFCFAVIVVSVVCGGCNATGSSAPSTTGAELASGEAADGTDEAAGAASSLVGAADPPPTLLSASLILLLTTLGVTWCSCGDRRATLPVHTFTHAYKVLPKGNRWNLLTRKNKK